jgi:hypothetical protein
MPSLPNIKYNFSLSSSLSGWIVVGAERVHRVADEHEFYRALGYTDQDQRAGVMPDEWVWLTYACDGAPLCSLCLQARIAAYLHACSEKFRATFGNDYDAMKGSCTQACLDKNDQCLDCAMHPRNANGGR